MSSDWREHPKLKGRFLQDYPDDLQVLIHDGGPRISRNPAEAVWVTVTGMAGEVFRGRVLNQPHNLRSVRELLNLAKEANIRLQLSHQIFVGRRTWRTTASRPCRSPRRR